MKRALIILLMPMLLFSAIMQPTQHVSAATNLTPNVGAAILIDAETGKILYEQNADEIVAIASITKLLAEYILLDEIAAGKLKWEDTYDMTPSTYLLSQNRLLSNVPLREDGTYELWELYEAMAIYSANAATVAIAERVAGSEKAFLELMNKKIESLGVKDYQFVNVTGLNNEYLNGNHPAGSETDENMMSAKSVAMLTYNLLKSHPEVLETASVLEKTFREGTSDAILMRNWNLMLPGSTYAYEGVDGLKTGTTDLAGHSFVGTAERNGRRVIAVVLNAKEEDGSVEPQTRFVPTKNLFDFAFNQTTQKEILKAGATIEGSEFMPVVNGKQEQVKIATAEGISLVTTEDAVYEPVVTLNAERLDATVEEGTVVGHVVMQRVNGDEYGYLEDKPLKVDLVTTESVERLGWAALFFAGVGSFYSEIWAGIKEFAVKLF